MIGGYVHITYFRFGYQIRFSVKSSFNFFSFYISVLVAFNGGVSNGKFFFLQSIQVFYLAGQFAILNFYIRSFNHTEFIYAGVQSQVQNKTYVGTFGGMNRTKSAVVGRMNITNLKTSATSVKTAGTKCRKLSQMLNFGKRIFLAHKLRKLISCKKFFKPSLQWFGHYKLDGQSNIGIYR